MPTEPGNAQPNKPAQTVVPFHIARYSDADKHIDVYGPGIHLEVDFDDVDHDATEAALKRMVEILNREWPKEGPLAASNQDDNDEVGDDEADFELDEE